MIKLSIVAEFEILHTLACCAVMQMHVPSRVELSARVYVSFCFITLSTTCPDLPSDMQVNVSMYTSKTSKM